VRLEKMNMDFDENHVPNEYPEGNEKLKALNYGN